MVPVDPATNATPYLVSLVQTEYPERSSDWAMRVEAARVRRFSEDDSVCSEVMKTLPELVVTKSDC